MSGGADGISHIVEAVKDGDEIVVLSRKFLRLGNAKSDAVREVFAFRRFPGGFDGFVVIIESIDLGLGKGFGHQNGGGTFTAAYVRDSRARIQFLLHLLKRGNPGTDEVGRIPGTKEFFAAMENAVIVLVPAHPRARAEGFGDAWHGGE